MALRPLTKLEVSLIRTRPPTSQLERTIITDRQHQREQRRERILRLYRPEQETS
jgi:hypothetical protein